VDYDRERTEIILRVRQSEGRGHKRKGRLLATMILAAVAVVVALAFLSLRLNV